MNTQPTIDDLKAVVEPFAAFCSLVEKRTILSGGQRIPDETIILSSSGEAGLGVLTMGHLRDALKVIPDPAGWSGFYQSPVRNEEHVMNTERGRVLKE